MTSKKTACHFRTCALLHYVFVVVWDHCRYLAQLRDFKPNATFRKYIFSNYVCKLLTLLSHHLKSSDCIKPFQVKSIYSFELNKSFYN